MMITEYTPVLQGTIFGDAAMDQYQAMPPVVQSGMDAYGRGCEGCKPASIAWGVVRSASIGVSAYHGYKRNNGSIGWAIGWALLGGLFPVIVPAIAVAQGLGDEK